MVAITVILAAVIAAFVFGMSGNISKTKVVAVTVTKQGTSGITLTNQGGQDQGSLIGINATTSPNTATGCSGTTGVSMLPAASGNCNLGNPRVGSTITLTNPGGYIDRTRITAVGTFTDGVQQVLLDTYL